MSLPVMTWTDISHLVVHSDATPEQARVLAAAMAPRAAKDAPGTGR